MYTEPHPHTNRSLWLETNINNRKTRMRVYYEGFKNNNYMKKLSPKEQKAFKKFQLKCKAFSAIPTVSLESELLSEAPKFFQISSDASKLILFEQAIDQKQNTWSSKVVYGKL